MRKLLLQNASAINSFANKLSKSNKVNSYDTKDEKECGTIAHSFSDIEESFSKFLDVYLPRVVMDNLTPEEIEDILFDIGEEFRHILYHIKDLKYFRHLVFDTTE
jgi:hypothetical protein